MKLLLIIQLQCLPVTHVDATMGSSNWMHQRVQLLIRRFLRARRFGVHFTGTSNFRMPSSLSLCGQKFELAVPAEAGAGLDFINLALDDEYGLTRLPFKPCTILDIGANFGLFSLLAAHYFPGSRIHAYEPNPRIFHFAAKNLERISGAMAYRAGLGSRHGMAEMRDEGDSRYASTVLSEHGNVEITTLGTAIERLSGEVDVVKLDCEGAEWGLFQDADAFNKVKIIRMEYHLIGGRRLEDVTASAKRLGFQVDRLTPNQGFGIAWLSKRA